MIEVRGALVVLAAVGLIAAGCGDDDDGDATSEESETALAVPGAEEAATLQEEIADLPAEEQVARVGDEWAQLYGNRDETMCGYLHPDLGGASSCTQYTDGSLTQSTKLQADFKDATVDSVEIDGDSALAVFDNGNQAEFKQDSDGAWKVVDTARAASSGSDEVIQPE